MWNLKYFPLQAGSLKVLLIFSILSLVLTISKSSSLYLFSLVTPVQYLVITPQVWSDKRFALEGKNTFPQYVLGCQPLQVVLKYSFEAVNGWLGLHIQHPTFVANPPQPPLEEALEWPFWARCVLGHWCSPFSLRSSLQKSPRQLFACWVSAQMLWNLIIRFI